MADEDASATQSGGTPPATPPERVATRYKVLQRTSADGAKEETYKTVLADVEASAAPQARRAYTSTLPEDKREGTFVAVAHSSFQEATLKLDTVVKEVWT